MPILKYTHDWSLDEALALIREIQPKIKQFQYHVTLGGGVLNRGYSSKDLDLYFLPFSDEMPGGASEDLRAYLQGVLGEEFTLGGPDVHYTDIDAAYPDQTSTYLGGRFTYRNGEKRVDVFII